MMAQLYPDSWDIAGPRKQVCTWSQLIIAHAFKYYRVRLLTHLLCLCSNVTDDSLAPIHCGSATFVQWFIQEKYFHLIIILHHYINVIM